VKLVTVGDVMLDVVADRLPVAGERTHGAVQLRPGGSAVNAALAARELGAAAQVVGRVGRDPAGDMIVVALEESGVEARLARDKELPTGTAIALSAAVVADRGANARLSSDDLPSPLQGDALLVSGFALFQEGSREARSRRSKPSRGSGPPSISRHLGSPARTSMRASSLRRPPRRRPCLASRTGSRSCASRTTTASSAHRPSAPAMRSQAAFLVALAAGADVEEARRRAVTSAASAARGSLSAT
jgi:sugar/nucleoside kinase (ribokinase family)